MILVSEMRDPETIQFALTITQTGHLVFATLHRNDTLRSAYRSSIIKPGGEGGGREGATASSSG